MDCSLNCNSCEKCHHSIDSWSTFLSYSLINSHLLWHGVLECSQVLLYLVLPLFSSFLSQSHVLYPCHRRLDVCSSLLPPPLSPSPSFPNSSPSPFLPLDTSLSALCISLGSISIQVGHRPFLLLVSSFHSVHPPPLSSRTPSISFSLDTLIDNRVSPYQSHFPSLTLSLLILLFHPIPPS